MASFTFAVLACAVALTAAVNQPNMNGEYILSNTPHSDVSKFPTQFDNYPRPVEFFDVYSPTISSLYSQVYWTGMDPVSIPQEIIDRFDGKGMAIVGFEMDQVRKTPAGDVSVPITVAYNHHHESYLTGKKSKMVKYYPTGPHDPVLAMHGHHQPNEDFLWIPKSLVEDNDLPTSAGVGAANGGEYRKSFHGWAPGYSLLIDSPTTLHVTPMQIDTWNRDKMNLTGGAFVPGPVPRTSLAPTEGPDALYSGLLECPLTTRIRKLVDGSYTMAVEGSCANEIATAEECWEAATTLGLPSTTGFTDASGSNSSAPAGCSISTANNGKNVTAFFNKAASTVPCGSGVPAITGAASSLVDLQLTVNAKGNATITMTGPANVWFGVGFNATAMKDAPWAVIVDGSGAVTERKLADQSPGTALPTSVSVVSASVSGGRRTVVLTRPLKGLTPSHFTFDVALDVNIPFINAIGKTAELSYHANRTAANIVLLPAAQGGACVCAHQPAPFGQGKGSLEYIATGTRIGFGNRCAPQPRSDLLAQKNPTCDVRTYVGGQTACHHMWSLLDADQEIPWQDQPLEYHMKFRFWFQEYNASYHKGVSRTTWGIASPVEYDVPQCAPGTATADCIHEITGTFGVGAPKGKQMKLVAAHFHCHAPTCLDVTLYNNSTGEVICREEPIYGGTGKIDQHKYDEPGYILQPPCLWGDAEFGLEAPVVVGGQTLHVIKHSNSTYGHHGEMAWLQMHYIEE